jgi:hypothetical protein
VKVFIADPKKEAKGFTQHYHEQVFGCTCDPFVTRAGEAGQEYFRAKDIKPRIPQGENPGAVMLRPPNGENFTWKWPPETLISAAERDVAILLGEPNKRFRFVDNSDRPRRERYVGELWGNLGLSDVYIRASESIEPVRLTVLWEDQELNLELQPSFPVSQLRKEFIEKLQSLGVEKTEEGLELRNGETLLSDERMRDLRGGRITAVYPTGCFTFQIDGDPSPLKLPIEEGKTVAGYYEMIREAKEELTGTLAMYFRGRILSQDLILARFTVRHADVFHIFHAELHDVDLERLRSIKPCKYDFHVNDRKVEVRVPPHTTVGAALRAIARKGDKRFSLFVNDERLANSQSLSEVRPGVELVVVRRDQESEGQRALVALKTDERQEIDRLSAEARLRGQNISQEKLALKLREAKNDMEAVRRYVSAHLRNQTP